MTDQEETNRQHMEAMGLAGVPLGERYERRATTGDRCSATNPETGSRCAIKAGHPSSHARGTEYWQALPIPTKQRPGDQPLPVVNDSVDIQTMVIEDIQERRRVGISRYGTPLQAGNGRDALQDLYEELMDALVYTKQLMVERDGPPS